MKRKITTDISKMIKAKVGSKISSNKNLFLIETNRLICNVNKLTGFYLVHLFRARHFRTH